QAEQFVVKMLKRWRHLGLLRQNGARQSIGSGEPPEDPWYPSPAPSAVLRVGVNPRRRHYRLINTKFSLGFSSTAVEAAVHPILAHLELQEAEGISLRLDVIET